jgi:hypothetical protein
VVAYARTDTTVNALTNYEIRVGDDSDISNNPSCGGLYTGTNTISCDLVGRYVGIYERGNGIYMSVCNVEFYGQDMST